MDREGICAVVGTHFLDYPTGLRAFVIRFGTGRDRQAWDKSGMDEICAWAKAQGCTKREGVFRIGWRRVLTGWLHTHDFLESDL